MLRSIAGGLLLGTAGFTWAVGVEPHWFEVVEATLPLAGLPASWVGKRIVQLSDMHIGDVDVDYLARACRQVNALRPDLIVMTGDYIDHAYAGDAADLARVMSALAPAPLGTFACMGNHDYGSGLASVRGATANRVAATLRAAGVRVLRDERVVVDGLTIVGLDDLWKNWQASGVLATVDTTRDAICLLHNPDACDRAVWGEFRGRVLCGHTHGGQCRVPFYGPPVVPVSNRRYIAGHYVLDDRRSLYINRGIGHTMRVRFNCRPEITVFTLVAA